jgi:hypothetical protein
METRNELHTPADLLPSVGKGAKEAQQKRGRLVPQAALDVFTE